MGRKPKWMREIVVERINRLLKLAEEHTQAPNRAKRYVSLARKIAMKYNVRIPRYWRRKICPYCHTFLRPGYNCRIRLRSNRFPHVVITCLRCKNIVRIPYIRGKQEKQ